MDSSTSGGVARVRLTSCPMVCGSKLSLSQASIAHDSFGLSSSSSASVPRSFR